jgi:hypothetical protein
VPARAADTLELLAMTRTNNRTASLAFRVPPRQAHVSELRIRSGSLVLTLEAVEIEFADGGSTRILIGDTLAPGHDSRPLPIDPRRGLSRVLVMKRPGLRPGETAIQLLGRIAAPAR